MQTRIRLGDPNCPWCLDELLDRLRSLVGVTEVRSDVHTGCLEIEHDDTVTNELVAVIGGLHGWDVATNGERVMIEVEAHRALRCPTARPGWW